MNKKLDKLLLALVKEDKEIKVKREAVKKTVEGEYQVRKKKYPQLPKYLKITKLDF